MGTNSMLAFFSSHAQVVMELFLLESTLKCSKLF